ncbi:hypothetical protein RKD19_005616 [Streptomyces canus]
MRAGTSASARQERSRTGQSAPAGSSGVRIRCHSIRNSASRSRPSADPSRRGSTARKDSEPTVATGAPVASAAVTATASPPSRVIRTRRAVAPVACRVTPFHAKGSSTRPGSVSATAPKLVACRAASRSAGCSP